MSGTALRERAALLDELHQIVLAMKNLALSELQRLGRQVEALRPALATVCTALQDVSDAGVGHAAVPSQDRPGGAVGWWVIGAERGFCGAHNSHLAQVVRDLRGADPRTCFWLASRRLQTLLEDLPGAVPVPLAACAAIEEVDDTLDDWWAMLDPVLAACRELWLLYPDESGLVRRRLWPPEPPDRPASLRTAPAPVHYLSLQALTAALTRQLLQLRLRVALMAALTQENHARLAQMQRAQDHLDELGRSLRQRYAQQRQAQITDELETLMSSIDA
ncbi:F0F1 ATP synthase subunit gamma [Sphaerotilus sp.]|uniref:F0F1 ATP synthase subunit gamma n=1 Tax=Sphaerotilus sp. TaxID=2093942 RepID=UPI0034E2C028